MEDESLFHYTSEGVRTFMSGVATVLAELDILYPETQLIQEFTKRLEVLTPSASMVFPKLLLEDEETVSRLTRVLLAILPDVRATWQKRIDDELGAPE